MPSDNGFRNNRKTREDRKSHGTRRTKVYTTKLVCNDKAEIPQCTSAFSTLAHFARTMLGTIAWDAPITNHKWRVTCAHQIKRYGPAVPFVYDMCTNHGAGQAQWAAHTN